MLLLTIFALLLRLIDADSGSSDEENGNAITAGSNRVESNQELASSEPARCQICGLCFINLGIHMAVHIHQKPFKCSHCGKQFTRAKNLKSHQQMHSGEKLHDCPTCDKQFTRPETLRKHQQLHTGVKSFRCAECGKQFAYAHSLYAHQRTHTGEKPFACPDCGKQFTRAGNLKTHQRTHTIVKSFRCTKCDKQFASAYGLNGHQRAHTAEKPFICPVCGKEFASTDDLWDHQLLHITEKPSYSTECGQQSTSSNDLLRYKHTQIDVKLSKCCIFNHTSLTQGELRNFDDSPSFAQTKNFTEMEKPFFPDSLMEILIDNTSLNKADDSTIVGKQFLSQTVLENPVLDPFLTQMDNTTEQGNPFLFYFLNPAGNLTPSEIPRESPSFGQLQNPNTSKDHYLLQKPADNNPPLMSTEEDTVLQEVIDIASLIQADKHSVPESSFDFAHPVQMKGHILKNAEDRLSDVQLPSSDAIPGNTYLECPVCFVQFGERVALEDHMLNEICSLYPLDWLPYVETNDSSDLAK